MARLALAALLFSVMALCAKGASARLPGVQIAFLRFVFGLLVGGLAVLCGRRLAVRSPAGLALRGAFGGGAVIMYFVAISRLPVGLATLLNYSSPIFTVLFSALFLGERLGARTAIGLLVASSGVVMVIKTGRDGLDASAAAPAPLSSMLIGLGSAVLSGAAVTTIRAIRQKDGAWEIFLSFCLIGALLTAWPALTGWVPPAPADWAQVAGVGASSLLAQMLMTEALAKVHAIRGGLMLQLTPVSTFLFGLLIYAERPGGLGLLGALATILGIILGLSGGSPRRATATKLPSRDDSK